MLDVYICPGHLLGHIEPRHSRPHDPVLAAGFGRRIVRVCARQLYASRVGDSFVAPVERPVPQQRAIGHRSLRIACHGYHALGDCQLRHRHLQTLRGQRQQRSPRLSSRGAELGAADAGRSAGCSEAVGGDKRIGPDSQDLTEVEIKLLRRNLAQRRRSTLTDIDITGENGRRVIRMDRDIRVDLRIIWWAGHRSTQPPRRGCAALSSHRQVGTDGEAHDQGARAFQKLATRRRGLFVSVFHVTAPSESKL